MGNAGPASRTVRAPYRPLVLAQPCDSLRTSSHVRQKPHPNLLRPPASRRGRCDSPLLENEVNVPELGSFGDGEFRGSFGDGLRNPEILESFEARGAPIRQMARFARVVAPGCWHHVTQRGNRRQTVFFSDDDRAVYLRLLGLECGRHGVRIAGYCLLSNHVHVVAIPSAEDSMAKAFGRAHVGYARWLNVRRGETGHVWQNRYFSCPLDERHRWEALRYVELNPVRAGLVKEASEYRWSSAGWATWASPADVGVRPTTDA